MPASPRRILSLALPHLATDRIARQRWGRAWRTSGRPDHPPVAVTQRDGPAIRLAALDEHAQELGLRSGLGLAEARARHPGLDAHPADDQADLRFLEAIADWCDRYTPLVALDGRGGLFLDITGCSHLFGGEKTLMDDLLLNLFHQGLNAGAAIAATAGAAFALARYGSGTIAETGREGESMRPLPLAALRLDGGLAPSLARVGLACVGDIMSAPRAPLARRFGAHLLRRLDQALGREEEAISPRLPLPLLMAERRLAEPVILTEDIERLAELLAANLKTGLEQRGQGARVLSLALFRVDGAVLRLDLKFARPTRAPHRLRALVRERLAAIEGTFDPGYGFETVRLSVLQSVPMAQEQVSLADDTIETEALAAFTERVAARLGNDVIRVPVARASHVPERAVGSMAAAEILSSLWSKFLQPGAAHPLATERPVRLFERPEPVEAMAEVPDGPPQRFRWRRALHGVAKAEGPERIAGEWWVDGFDVKPRDYYRVEDDEGRRYWLYREGFYGSEALPRWYLHGLFA
ncbi:MAG: DNA polymerase Y family protein [Rhizobiaceae bacterium]